MRRLHPATVVVAFLPKLAEAFRSVLPFLLISFLGGGDRGDRSELAISLVGILGGFGAIGAYMTTRFEVADGQIVHRTGWIYRRDRRIPLAQVQNVNLRQGLLERWLKVITVEIETAAGKGAELRLAVLSEPEAERLRSELIAEASLPEEAAREGPVYRIGRHDLWLGAATENHPVAFLFAVVPLVGAGRFLFATEALAALPTALRWTLGVVAVLLALFGGWAFGAVQYALRYGGFAVLREPGVLRVSYGMLTKVAVAIRLARVEYALIATTPWQRLVGRVALSVGTAGTFGEQGTVAKIALMMPRAQVAAALADALPGFGGESLAWRAFPRRYVAVVLGRGLLGFVVALLFSGLAFALPSLPARWLFFVFPLLALGALLDRLAGARRAAYALGGGFLAVRQGYFRQRTEILPLARIEVATVRQPPWWRGRGLVVLGAKAMIHSVELPIVPDEVARELETALRAPASV